MAGNNLPVPATVTELYLAAILGELKKLTQEYPGTSQLEDQVELKEPIKTAVVKTKGRNRR